MRFVYKPGSRNVGLLFKTVAEESEYEIDFAAGVLTGDSISTVSTATRNSSNSSADTTLLDATSNSGTITTVRLLTGGTSGTADATNNARFKLTTTANLTNGGELQYVVFLQAVGGATYGPTS